eukprot:CAMPEP_0185775334 /NCGR_PEP_ID=MMETSP1174-20130828/81671_1 /TAXON_ID=35687 /ORGANISM="Dictyocha speculum, Strain CCMP1381" /LENGTH=131 /DNA_ID=CAMNT_0028462869 /DNA_START=1 /DNA_END=393 /DNA_ORIENTATION=+
MILILFIGILAWPSSSLRLKVISYNVHAWRDSVHEDNLEQLIETIKAENPDVVALNEVLHPFVAPSDPNYWALVAAGKGIGYAPPPNAEPHPDDPNNYLRRLSTRTGLIHTAFAEASRDACFFGRFGFGNA